MEPRGKVVNFLPSNKRESWLFLLLFIILAYGFRLAMAYYHRDTFWDYGYQSADILARNLLQGRGFTLTGEPYSFDAPGYSIFLALSYLVFGHTWLAVGLIHSAFGALTCFVVYQIGKRIFGTRSGMIAALLTAIYPYSIYNAAWIYDTTLFTLLVALSTLSFLWLKEQPSFHRSVLTGLLLGLGCLVRSTLIASFPAFCGYLFLSTRRREAWKVTGIVTLTFIITIAPWTYRNYCIKGAFIPIDSKGMTNIFMGNNMLTLQYMREGILLDHTLALVPKDYSFSNAEMWDTWFGNQTLNFLREHPQRFLATWGMKVWTYWTPWHAFKEKSACSLKNLIYTFSYGPLLGLAIAGIWVSFRRFPETKLFLLIFAVFTLVHLISWSAVRLRAPLDPLLTVFAGFSAEYFQLRKAAARNR